jgi:hypothetical protein
VNEKKAVALNRAAQVDFGIKLGKIFHDIIEPRLDRLVDNYPESAFIIMLRQKDDRPFKEIIQQERLGNKNLSPGGLNVIGLYFKKISNICHFLSHFPGCPRIDYF